MVNNFPGKPDKKHFIYLDHAATTYVLPEVKEAMEPYFSDYFANPSSLYNLGRKANGVLNDARRSIAEIIGALPDTIIFTSGGTESDNLAIFGIAKKHFEKGKHIITTRIEHKAVLEPCQQLEKEGFEVTYLSVNEFGQINIDEFKKALRRDTILVSIMYANNEVGAVEPISEIGKEILKWRKNNNTNYPFFHSDACQAAGVLELDIKKLHVDLMTINGSKIYGPKGAGILFKTRGLEIAPILFGGGQEMNLRSGTENVPAITGLAKALELAQKNRMEENQRLINLRNYFWEQIKEKIPKIQLNGPKLEDEMVRLPNNLNVSIFNIEGEALLLYLDEYGIACSTGSACSSQSLEPSYVLTACGLSHNFIHGTLRFTLGKCNTKEDIDYVMTYLPRIVAGLRNMSPVRL